MDAAYYLHFITGYNYPTPKEQFLGITNTLNFEEIKYPPLRKMEDRFEVYKLQHNKLTRVAIREIEDPFEQTWCDWEILDERI